MPFGLVALLLGDNLAVDHLAPSIGDPMLVVEAEQLLLRDLEPELLLHNHASFQ